MKSLTAIAMMAFALSFCNLSQRLANRTNHNRAPVKTVQPATPAYGTHYAGKMEDLFPQKVLEYPLVFTINPRNFGFSVPEGTEVRGGVYRSRKNEIVKHMLVKLVGRFPATARGQLMRTFLPWGDLIMMRRQLLNFKKLAEKSVEK